MSQRVLFNGAVLVRPGAATKIDASQFQNVVLDGIGIVGLIGEAESGVPHSIQVFNSAQAVQAYYASGDLVEAAQISAQPANDNRLGSGATTIVCYKMNNSTPATLNAGSPTTLQFTSILQGIRANNNTIAISDGGSSSRIVTATTTDLYGNTITETSPQLGLTGYFTIQYVGSGSAATMTITSTQLTTTVTGASGDNLTIVFANYRSLNDIIIAIAQQGHYTCAALTTNAPSFNPANLDAVTSVDVKTSLYTAFARNYDIANWVNTNSQINTVTLVQGNTSPIAVMAQTAMAGGTRGTSTNSDWANAFIALRTTRINQMVPLVSQDATTLQGSFTFLSIAAAFQAHLAYVSSTAGRNECQGWYGYHASITALITEANLRNSADMILTGQQATFPRTYDGALTVFPEWGLAVCLAGARAGAQLGEPLTWKYLNIQGITQDASWLESNNDNVTLLDLNGVVVVNNIIGKGFRVDKCITTYTRFANDAYMEESIVQIWKDIAYNLRTNLEDTYVGRPGNTATINNVPNTVVRVLEPYRDSGSITDSNVNGVVTYAYRSINYNLTGDQLYVSVTVSPTPGINFVLNTITLVPPSFAAAA